MKKAAKKKKSASNLGRSLVKDRFGANSGKKIAGDSLLHTSEINDGQDWARLNLKSVTEESSFQEFLSTAELAGKEFQAERLNAAIVSPSHSNRLLTKMEETIMEASQKENQAMLSIPRRPAIPYKVTPDELAAIETKSYMEWRRSMVAMEDRNEGLILTPYERNIAVWRELWRTVAKSTILVQIVDARNPLLYRCEDLERYTIEVNENKENLLLLNKADLLTEKQRQIWSEYLNSLGVEFVFFSALLAQEKVENLLNDDKVNDTDVEKTDSFCEPEKLSDNEKTDSFCEPDKLSDNEKTDSFCEPEKPSEEEDLYNSITTAESKPKSRSSVKTRDLEKFALLNTCHILACEELIELLNAYTYTGVPCVGFVGYPNVGKSSTINALMNLKKAAVSSTPGKTKHMQTLYVGNLMLCDCPGLVMPSFVFSKAEMVINGILPVDQLTEHKSPVELITRHIPRYILEEKYGIMLPLPKEGENPDRPSTADELLNTYGYMRGFMTQRGLPDTSRAARIIIKDYLAAKLLYCTAPPGYDQYDYHQFPRPKMKKERAPVMLSGDDLDKMFFTKMSLKAHVKGLPPRNPTSIPSVTFLSGTSEDSSATIGEKPWKRHHNRNKKEKLRRVYAYLDQ